MRRISILAGLAVPLAGFAFDTAPYDAVSKGNALYQAGDYEAAAAHYATAAAALPNTAEIQFNQGNVYFKRYDLEKAIEHYTRALDTSDRRLESRIKYNLGNVKYQQALGAMQSFQDAATPLRAAMTYYRDSLKLDRGAPDTRYNLELANRLLGEIQRQKVQAQENAEIRNQQTSRNQGQPFREQSEEQRSSERDAAGPEPRGGRAAGGYHSRARPGGGEPASAIAPRPHARSSGGEVLVGKSKVSH